MCAEAGRGLGGFGAGADGRENVEDVRLGSGVEEFVDEPAADGES